MSGMPVLYGKGDEGEHGGDEGEMDLDDQPSL